MIAVGLTPNRAARNPLGSADQDAEGIRGREQSRARLGEIEALGIVREKGRERGEEERVHEHDRAGEDEDAAH